MYHLWKRSYLGSEQTMLHDFRSIQSAQNLLFFVRPVQTYPGAFPTLKDRKGEGRETRALIEPPDLY